MPRIVPAFTVSSRSATELIAELRYRGALRYDSAVPVRILHFGGEYVLDQLLTLGVVREGGDAGTYYLDEETLAPVELRVRQVHFIGYAVVVLVAGSLLAALLLQLFQ